MATYEDQQAAVNRSAANSGALTQNPGAVTVDDPNTISKEAQDVAKATGVAYSDLSKPSAVDKGMFAGYDAGAVKSQIGNTIERGTGDSFVTDKSTVSGQLSSLLSSDSPYIQQARLAGERQAAGRGMLNSSMAAGASQAEAIRAAAPIAQQDAQTFANANRAQQDFDYNQQKMQTEAIISGEMVTQKAQIAQQQQNVQNAFNAAMAGASEQSKVFLQGMQNEFNQHIQQMSNEVEKWKTTTALNADQRSYATAQAASIMSNAQISVENLMQDPGWQEMDPAKQKAMLNNVMTMARNNVKVVGRVSGINLDSIAQTFLQNFS